MPAARFVCPDGVEINIGECLSKCRMAARCLTLPTLILIAASERPWDGRPSTTRLLNGTMLEYLKATMEYAIKPKDRAFSLLGSNHHDRLARIETDGIAEQTAGGDGPGPKGTPDLLEPDEDNPGSYIIVDYKTYGSYRVVKLLGIVKTTELHPTEVYSRSGKWGKAGSPKKITVFREDAAKAEISDEALQLNHYRILLKSQGYSVTGMKLQVTVRDGGLQIARERGITDSIYVIPVPWIDDLAITTFFDTKSTALINAVNTNTMPSLCTDTESWDKRRCKDYCEVAGYCPQGQRVLAGGK